MTNSLSRFFLLTTPTYERANAPLRAACATRSVELVEIYPGQFDYGNLPQVGPSDMLYRAQSAFQGPSATLMPLEQYLLVRGVTSFYKSVDKAFALYTNQTMPLEQNGLPVIPTIHGVTRDRKVLRQYVDQLGGFPVVVKALGGQNGQGVLRADSWAALFSLVDFVSLTGQLTLMMPYLPHSQYRLVVVGDRVVAASRQTPHPQDFRSNTGMGVGEGVPNPPAELCDIAVRATHTFQWEFGGVDVLEDTRDGKWYLSEVNFPCAYYLCQDASGIDIGSHMVDYLLKKSRAAVGVIN